MSKAKPPKVPEIVSSDPKALIGRTIGGRYRVQSLLGTGGMGAVYLVEHTGIDKRMALKVLSEAMMANPKVVARFEREAKAAANFGHPHVAAASDYGRMDDGRFYLVLEYVEGKELREAMDDVNGPLPPSRAFFIARQIVSALNRAHKLGIVHRDLKPENIMLVQQEGTDDFVKVLDFGLALVSRHLSSAEGDEHRAETAPKITAVGEIFGTPSYMAPEQTIGAATDTRTDLYAVGILLYEMLTGQRPFVGKNAVALIQQQLATPPPPMKERSPDANVPADMEALVMKLLAKQASARYQSPEELLVAIDQLRVTHGFAWPGMISAAVAPVAEASSMSGKQAPVKAPKLPALAKSVATIRGHISSGLERARTRLFPRPKSRFRRVLDAVQDKLGPKRKSPVPLLLMVGGGVLVVVLGIALWYFTRAPEPEETQPSSTPAPAALSTPAPASTKDAEPTPPRRGSKSQRSRGERRP